MRNWWRNLLTGPTTVNAVPSDRDLDDRVRALSAADLADVAANGIDAELARYRFGPLLRQMASEMLRLGEPTLLPFSRERLRTYRTDPD